MPQLKLLFRANRLQIFYPVDTQDPIQMIDLMLQQLRQILFRTRIHLMPLTG